MPARKTTFSPKPAAGKKRPAGGKAARKKPRKGGGNAWQRYVSNEPIPF